MRAAGGTSVPLMLDWLMWLSMPKVNAECEKPETQNTISFMNNRAPISRAAKTQHKYLSGQPTNKVRATQGLDVIEVINYIELGSISHTKHSYCQEANSFVIGNLKKPALRSICVSHLVLSRAITASCR